MGLDKSLNQSLQGGLEKIGYMSSNGPLRNCCKVSDKYLIGHVLGEQNGGSTHLFFKNGVTLGLYFLFCSLLKTNKNK